MYRNFFFIPAFFLHVRCILLLLADVLIPLFSVPNFGYLSVFETFSDIQKLSLLWQFWFHVKFNLQKKNFHTVWNNCNLVGNTGSMWFLEGRNWTVVVLLCCNPFEVKISQARIFTEKIPKEILWLLMTIPLP